jgi:hypothetical protein
MPDSRDKWKPLGMLECDDAGVLLLHGRDGRRRFRRCILLGIVAAAGSENGQRKAQDQNG